MLQLWLGDTALTALTEKSFNAMTSNGDTKLSLHMYKLSFLNFLLGKVYNYMKIRLASFKVGPAHEIAKYGIHSFTQITLAVDKELTYN